MWIASWNIHRMGGHHFHSRESFCRRFSGPWLEAQWIFFFSGTPSFIWTDWQMRENLAQTQSHFLFTLFWSRREPGSPEGNQEGYASQLASSFWDSCTMRARWLTIGFGRTVSVFSSNIYAPNMEADSGETLAPTG